MQVVGTQTIGDLMQYPHSWTKTINIYVGKANIIIIVTNVYFINLGGLHDTWVASMMTWTPHLFEKDSSP
jgi:hypothetical protein